MKDVESSKIIGVNEIRDKFNNIRLMTKEEKENYIQYKKLKNNIKIGHLIMSIVYFVIAMGLFLSIFSCESLGKILLLLALAILFAFLGKVFFSLSQKDIKLIQTIWSHDMYIAKCSSYDAKIATRSIDAANDYYIKVTDKEHYLDKWIEIYGKFYPHHEAVEGELIYLPTEKEDILDVMFLSK